MRPFDGRTRRADASFNVSQSIFNRSLVARCGDLRTMRIGLALYVIGTFAAKIMPVTKRNVAAARAGRSAVGVARTSA